MFLENKDQDNSYIHDPQLVDKLAFLVDITSHMNNFNVEQQGKNKVVFEMLVKLLF